MRVELPRACRGSEILDAFRRAAQINPSSFYKWTLKDLEGTTEYSSSLSQFVTAKGVDVIRNEFYKSRKYIFWGEEEVGWMENRDEVIRLNPVREDFYYNVIDIGISVYVSEKDELPLRDGWYDALITSCLNHQYSPILKNYKPVFEEILTKMIEILKESSNGTMKVDGLEVESKVKKGPPPPIILPNVAYPDAPYGD